MPFGDHLEELRARLIRGLIAPILVAIPCLIWGGDLLQLFLRPVQWALASEHLPFRLQTLSPIEAFVSYIKISIVAALVFSAPVIVYQLWRFVAPGLHEHERRFARLLVPFSAILVIIGVTFLFTVALPLSLRMLVRFGKSLDVGPSLALVEEPPPTTNPTKAPDLTNTEDSKAVDTPDTNAQSADSTAPPRADQSTRETIPIEGFQVPMLDHQPWNMKPGDVYFDTRLNQFRIMIADGKILGSDFMTDVGLAQQFQLHSYLNLVLALILAFSIAFQLPLVLLLLGWVGIVDVKTLKSKRKIAFLLVFIAGAMLTPPDVVSQIALAVPLYFLYELGIILLRIFPSSRSVNEP